MLGVYVRLKSTILHHEHESTDFLSTTHLLCQWKVCIHEQNQSITFMLHNRSMVVKTVTARHQKPQRTYGLDVQRKHCFLIHWRSAQTLTCKPHKILHCISTKKVGPHIVV